MNRWIRFSGILGLIFLLFGCIAFWVTGDISSPLILIHFIIGAALVITWIIGAESRFQWAGEVVTGRAARFGANAFLYIAVCLGLLTVINWFATKNDKRWDLTQEGVYSISSQSQQVIENLKRPLKLVALKGTENQNEEELSQLFDLYKYHNPAKVSSDLIDPRSKPHLVDTYEMKPGNVVYLEYGDGDTKGVSRINEASEEAITNAIIKLTRGDARKIYYVEGHDEPGLEDAQPTGLKEFADAVKDEHLSLASIVLAEKGSVPDDAAAIILASPKKALLPAEREMLMRYVEQGGRLVLFTDPRTTEDVSLLADHFGIKVGKDVIIDQVQRLFAAPALGAQPVVKEYAQHAITKNMSERSITIFNIASSISQKDKNESGGATYTELMKTGPSAWAETNVSAIFDTDEPTATPDETDTKGPVSLAVAFEKNIGAAKDADKSTVENPDQANFQKTSRVIVFGDSDWILNANLAVYSNRDLVLNSLNWLVGEEGGISIRPRSLKASLAPIKRDSFLVILVSSFLIPELILILGLMFWWKRKTAEAI